MAGFKRTMEGLKTNPNTVVILDEANRYERMGEVLRSVQEIPRMERPLFFSFTFNPAVAGLKGRSDVLDNPNGAALIPMAPPDFVAIAEALLTIHGFEHHEDLSKRVHALFEYARDNTTKKPHYDFGLRCRKVAFETAGVMLRQAGKVTEEVEARCISQAFVITLFARLTNQDMKKVETKLNELFPEIVERGAKFWYSILSETQRELAVNVEDELMLAKLAQFVVSAKFRHSLCALSSNVKATGEAIAECAKRLGVRVYRVVNLDESLTEAQLFGELVVRHD